MPHESTTTLPIGSIEIRERSRRDLRNIEALADSIRTVGVLNPPTVRRVGTDWVLVAGERRLAAMRHLGWADTPVTVAESIEDELTALYAERDENTQREDFSPSEMVVHARRIEARERDLAKQRQQIAGREHGRGIASADSAEAIEPRQQRETRHRTAKAVGTSHDTLSKARHVIDTAEDPATPPEVAEVAKVSAENLAQPGAVVDREHRAVREAEHRHAEKTLTDAVDERIPNAAAERARKAIRARWSKLIATAAEIPIMDAESVSAVLTDAEFAAAEATGHNIIQWLDAARKARQPGLRVVWREANHA